MYFFRLLQRVLTLSLVISSFSITFALDKGTRPHILYISADDLGYMDLACYAKDHLKELYYETPNLDKLAASGIRFTQGYAAAANCAPSRCCFMTGQWPQRHGVYTVGSSERGNTKDRKLVPIENAGFLEAEHQLLSETLKNHGYVTAHFGKWHITKDSPTLHGFDFNFAGTHRGQPNPNNKVARETPVGGYHSPYSYPNLECKKEGEYLTDRLAQEVVEFISKKVSETDQPLFIHYTPFTVHTPIHAKETLKIKYQNKEATAWHNNPSYAAMVHSLDDAVGLILNSLGKQGLLEKTLIVFTSDNGGVDSLTDNFPLRAGKGSYYEGGIREPFLISWKERILPKQIIKTPITSLDLYPTILSVANIAVPDSLDGQDLLPLLTGKNVKSTLLERPLFWHYPIYLQYYRKNDQETRDPLFRTRPGSSMRLGDWKLHHFFEDDAVELYNLHDDLSEQHNLVLTHPKKANQLKAILEVWRKQTKAPIPTKLNHHFNEPPVQ